MSRPPANPIAVWVGILVLYVVWGSTYLGMKVAMDTLPVFVMGVFRFVPAGVILSAPRHRLEPGPDRPAHPRAGPRRVDRRRDAPPRRDGPRRLGRADDPHRHRGAADRPRADVARDLRVRALPRVGAAARRRGHRRRPHRRRDPRLAGGRRRLARPGRPPRAHDLARALDARDAVRDESRRPAHAGAARERRSRCSPPASPSGGRGADRRVGRRSTWPPSPR